MPPVRAIYSISVAFLLFFFFVSINPGFAQSSSAAFTLHEGELDGAPYKVAVPDDWTDGSVFFHVHGWRPAGAPHEADFDPENPFYNELLNSGWAIARTAFYENGVDNEAHIRALWDLRRWIDENLGTTEKIIMEGESTAGSLVLRVAEDEPDLADGVIAKGAFIDLMDENADSYLKATPHIPAILMSNLTELDGPVAYAAASENAVVPPALRPLLRPGHVNVNWLERLDAFKSLNNWLDSGEISPVSDGTRMVPERDTGTIAENDMIVNNVTKTDPYFGNAILGFHPAELEELGIYRGEYFVLEIDGQQRDVFYGDSYGDVPPGEWVAFPTADDQILLARNHESAIKTAGLQAGDEVKIGLID